jgi:xylose isomerase
LIGAAKLIEDGKFDALLAERYAGWNAPAAKAMLAPGVSLDAIAARVAAENIDPKPRSGRQEFLENLVNRYV